MIALSFLKSICSKISMNIERLRKKFDRTAGVMLGFGKYFILNFFFLEVTISFIKCVSNKGII
ncbi:hypothetical protein KUTeg_008511 [Tegillarca granosa]|uniref:Uncharacterized protein n=1 Tax=Tegillarca granosa TaxID=220873 RepID=A0ABQ9FE71_TEGGR|nr:hypothetical protein KUTeg_008511 [Tegillarca granosa]